MAETLRLACLNVLQEREHSPIAIKIAKERIMREDGSSQYAYWFQARNIPDYETAYQKVRIICMCYASFTDHATSSASSATSLT